VENKFVAGYFDTVFPGILYKSWVVWVLQEIHDQLWLWDNLTYRRQFVRVDGENLNAARCHTESPHRLLEIMYFHLPFSYSPASLGGLQAYAGANNLACVAGGFVGETSPRGFATFRFRGFAARARSPTKPPATQATNSLDQVQNRVY